eukprot:scaffold231012_cov19-Tisochrysis_lutea.AAC.1
MLSNCVTVCTHVSSKLQGLNIQPLIGANGKTDACGAADAKGACQRVMGQSPEGAKKQHILACVWHTVLQPHAIVGAKDAHVHPVRGEVGCKQQSREESSEEDETARATESVEKLAASSGSVKKAVKFGRVSI